VLCDSDQFADTRRHLRPPTVTYLPYRVSGSTLMAVGRSQLLALWPGTHSRILSGIQRAEQTVLGVYLERTSSRVTLLVHPAHYGFSTIMRYTNPRTHSLTRSLFGSTESYLEERLLTGLKANKLLSSSHLIFYSLKNSCKTQLCTKFTRVYNEMLWRQQRRNASSATIPGPPSLS